MGEGFSVLSINIIHKKSEKWQIRAQDFSMQTRVLSSSYEKEKKNQDLWVVVLALMLLTHPSVLIFFFGKTSETQPYTWDRVILKIKHHYDNENILQSKKNLTDSSPSAADLVWRDHYLESKLRIKLDVSA